MFDNFNVSVGIILKVRNVYKFRLYGSEKNIHTFFVKDIFLQVVNHYVSPQIQFLLSVFVNYGGK